MCGIVEHTQSLPRVYSEDDLSVLRPCSTIFKVYSEKTLVNCEFPKLYPEVYSQCAILYSFEDTRIQSEYMLSILKDSTAIAEHTLSVLKYTQSFVEHVVLSFVKYTIRWNKLR